MAQVQNRAGEKVIQLWPEQIRVRKDGFNPRFDWGDIEGLAKSMTVTGIRMPLRGYKTAEKTDDGYPIYELTDGHRRLKAANKIKAKMEEGDFIPFVVEPAGYTDMQRAIDILITGENTKPLTLLESAIKVKFLVDGGMKQSEVARQIGKTPTHISDCLILMEKATPKMLEQIRSGVVTASTAVELLKANPGEVVEKSIDKAESKQKATGTKKKKLSATAIEEASGAAMTTKGKKKAADKEKTEAVEKTPKENPALTKLKDFRAAIKANTTEVRIAESFQLLNALIKFVKGDAEATDLLPLFFVQETEETTAGEEDTELYEPETKKKPVKKAAAPKEEPKAVKKAAPAKVKKEDPKAKKPKVVEIDDEEDLELEDVEDLEDEIDEELE